MPPVTNRRLPPLVWVAIAAVVSAAIRFVIALQVRAPVFYPDEYLTTDIARGIASGNLGSIRGGSLGTYTTYTSYFVPLVQSPLWLIENIDLSVRLSQGLGALAFAAAAFPAYALGRRVGISERGALAVALLALVLPAGAFTATLLAEPYAYPLFLLAVLVVVDAIARPSTARHAAAAACWIGLCFVGGLQFLYFGPAYAIAWMVSAWPSRRNLMRRLAVLAASSSAALALLVVSGHGQYIEVFMGAVRYQSYPVATLGSWVAVNAFVLAVAAGWVLVPGAVLGLHALGRTGEPRRRAFAFVSVFLIVAMLVEAAVWGANNNGVYERFTFYGAPLLAIAFVWAAEQTTPRRSLYAAVAYAAALAAVVLPVTEPLFAAMDHHSPAINGLSELTFGTEVGGGIWAPALALLAIGTAWRGLRHSRALLVVATAVCVFATIGQSVVFVRVTEDRRVPPHVRTPEGSAILTWPNASPFLLLDVLFWNPEITRVVVVGRGAAPDGLPSISTRLVAPGVLVAADGTAVLGPYVIGPDVTTGGTGATDQVLPRFASLPELPPLLGFGFRRRTGDMGTSARFYAAAGAQQRRVVLQLRSRARAKTIGVSCVTGRERILVIGRRLTTVSVPVPPHSSQSCLVYVRRGGAERIGRRQVGLEARLAFDR